MSAPTFVARHAMATRFEIVLHGADPVRLRAAGDEALDEIDRLEAQLSLYRPGSEVARLNRDAHSAPVRVTPALFRLLEKARALSEETGGAFDITVAPLVRCWGFMNGTGALPAPDDVEAARALVGFSQIQFHAAACEITFARPGVMIDLGAIGKGYAVSRAALVLREAGVTGALIHGGTSTAFALGRDPDGRPWKIAVKSPDPDPETAPLAVVQLENEALSVSAVWGRAFEAGGRTYGHVIDPRTGAPTDGAVLSAVVLPDATETDALSTALLTAPELMPALASRHPKLRGLVAQGGDAGPSVTRHGL